MAWRWGVPVQVYPLCFYVFNGNSGCGNGSFNGVLIPSLYLYPCLSDQRLTGSKEGLNHGPRPGHLMAPFLLELCLDLMPERPDVSLVSVPAPTFRNPGIYELPGIRG